MIKSFFASLLDLIYPEKIRCGFCGSEADVGTAGLCGYCTSLLPYLSENVCIKCGRYMEEKVTGNICRSCGSQNTINFDGGIVVFMFEGKIQDAIYKLKYNGEKDMASVIGILMADKYKSSGWDTDVIIPVPLHENRISERGYNQSYLLSIEIGRELNIDVNDDLMARRRDTISQTQLTGLRRIANVRDAFEVKSPKWVKGKRILLVDDVITTGATLNECSRILKNCGAADVRYIAAASPVFNENCINTK